jgi:hypothetical protein
VEFTARSSTRRSSTRLPRLRARGLIEKYDSVNPAALKRLIAGGASLRAFPQPVMEACYKATQDHLNEIAEKSPLFKEDQGQPRRVHEGSAVLHADRGELLRQLFARQNAQG